MKRSVLLLILVPLCMPGIAQVPQGFNYQAIARDAAGTPIANTTIQVKLAVMADSLGNIVYWEELFNPVTTNAYGLFTVPLGKGTRQVTSTLPSFSAINWFLTPVFVRTQIYQGTWKNMGSSRLWSVPYAMVANSVAGNQPYLNVVGTTALLDSALFVVRNNTGQVIFAVYNEGVRIYVDNGAKGNKGGFAIGGFGTSKAPSQEYFRITKDSARVYLNQNAAKGTKGGFAIGGFNGKGQADNYLNLTPKNYLIGQASGAAITSGIYNAFFGYQSGMNNTSGSSNVFIGYLSGLADTTGSNNLCIGTMTGKSLTNGNNNIFLGSMAGTANTGGPNGWQGSNNIFIGQSSGASNTMGGSNIFIGTNSGLQNDIGSMNIYVGDRSGTNSKAIRNTFIGASTGESNSTGSDNIFIGPQTAQNSTTGSNNTIIGSMAGWQNGTGSYNTYLGMYAGANGSNGSENVFVGVWSGTSAGSGGQGTYIGFQAGAYSTGSRNVFLGYMAGYNETAGSNRLYIDNNGNNSSNSLIYGEFDNHLLKLNAKVNIRDGLKLVPLSGAPAGPTEGDIYYNGTTHKLMVYDGTTWQACW